VGPLAGDDPAEVAGYQLRARLGSGGMGRVYLAFTPAGRPVALKVVRPDLGGDAEFRRRFRQEVDASRRVHGMYTAQVLDAGPDASPPWLVTAYVPGPSLHQAVAGRGPVPQQTVFVLLAGVAEALAAIHAAGIVHRDLKPSNVLLAPDGPWVIDFGIARAADSTVLTGTGMLIGSPPFMAPEQVGGLAVTPAVDVFALGAVAVFAATGRSPTRPTSCTRTASSTAPVRCRSQPPPPATPAPPPPCGCTGTTAPPPTPARADGFPGTAADCVFPGRTSFVCPGRQGRAAGRVSRGGRVPCLMSRKD
jgi:serine/threonine protein kinase